MQQLSLIQNITIWAIPILLAVTLHEAAHAFVANRLGDPTAKMLGRLTLNPIKHIDLFGTILLPILVGILSHFSFIFGYAKPVPVNFNQLKNPRRDSALVTAAGPGANFLMAIGWALLLKITGSFHGEISNPLVFLYLTSQAGILINLVLAFLNLLPIPPLDGSRVLASVLPPKQAYYYSRLEPYGFFILILLLVTGVLSTILMPPIQFCYSILMHWVLG